jgi:hypothetical protein
MLQNGMGGIMRNRIGIWAPLIAVLLTALLVSCSDNPTATDGTDSEPAWEAWRNPYQFNGYYFWAIWGSSDGNVFAVGQQGMVAQYDGHEWEIVRHIEYGPHLTDVWGTSGRDVFAIGYEGTILHFDGRSWESMESSTMNALNGIWGRTSEDVYAVGDSGLALHFNGDAWHRLYSGTANTLYDIWGDDQHVFAVGEDGTIVELTRKGGRAIDSGTINDLYGIGGSQATGLCAVGEAGTILQFDGASWNAKRSGTAHTLQNVCGTNDNHLFAVSTRTVLHCSGDDWEVLDADISVSIGYELIDVWANSQRNAYFLSRQKIWHYDGSVYAEMELPQQPSDFESLHSVWGSSDSDVYAVGNLGSIYYFDGNEWTLQITTVIHELSSVWGFSQNEIYAAGSIPGLPGSEWGEYSSTILSWSGDGWIVMNDFTDIDLRSLWGTSGDNLFAAGARTEYVGGNDGLKYKPLVLRYQGSGWNTSFEMANEGSMYDIWGSSETDVFAVGRAVDYSGLVLHFNGSNWTEMPSGTSYSLNAVWGSSGSDVFAVGWQGAIIHYDGSEWRMMDSGITEGLHDVWGTSATNVFAVGSNGVILHYDGSDWNRMSSPTANYLEAVWGSSEDNVFAVGEYGTILHYGP